MNWIDAGGINWHVEWRGHPENPLLVMLHGFAGSLRTWDELRPVLEQRFRLLLVDLPGHGATPLPAAPDFNMPQVVEALRVLLVQVSTEPALLAGYSMGGRLALQVAVRGGYLRGLILIGAAPGIADAEEREQRRLSDFHLAEDIRVKGSEWFEQYWSSLPLFASQQTLTPAVRERLRQSRLACDPRGLAYAVDKLSVGRQEFLGPHLKHLKLPLLLLAGARDEKFCASNRYIAAAVASRHVLRVEIPEAGHAALIEKPDDVAREIVTFCDTMF